MKSVEEARGFLAALAFSCKSLFQGDKKKMEMGLSIFLIEITPVINSISKNVCSSFCYLRPFDKNP